MPIKARTVGDLERAKKRLWRAILRASEIVEEPDPQLALKAIHALGQAVGAYTKVHEASDLEARLKALEEHVRLLNNPLRKVL